MKFEIHIQYDEGEVPNPNSTKRAQEMLEGPRWKAVVQELHSGLAGHGLFSTLHVLDATLKKHGLTL